MSLDLKEIVAVQTNQEGTIGSLLWYSVANELVSREELAKKLDAVELEEEWLPNKIRLSDAFRRATKEVQCRKATDKKGIYEKYLVREVFSDKDYIQRNIVVEIVDQNGKTLDYKPQSAVITLDKSHGNVTVVTEDGTAKALAEDARDKFSIYSNYYNGQQIRVMIGKMIKAFAPVP